MTMVLLASIEAGSAQVYFNTQIDWEQYFEYLSFVALANQDGDLFITGGAGNLSSTDNVTILANLTAEGIVKWQKKFLPVPGLYGETYYVAKLSLPYGILLGNYEKPISGGNYDKQIFLTKINIETGDVLWTKEFGFSNYTEQGRTIKSSEDGGVALCGTAFPSNSIGPTNMLFLKTDSLGNQVFRKEYTTDSTKGHYAYSFAKTADNGYLLIGYRSYNAHCLGCLLQEGMNDLVFIKTDSLGNEQWTKVYPSLEWKQILFYSLDLQALPNGEFLLAGLKGYAVYQPGNAYIGKYFLARINDSGEFVDSVTLDQDYYFLRVNRLKPSADGNFWAIGAERDTFTEGQTGLIMKISPELEVIWKREYRVSPPESTMHEMFYEGVEMPDKGFALCGTAFGPLEDSTWQNGWVIRVDSLGCLEPGCQLNSAVEDPPAAELDIGINLSPNPTSGQARLALTQEGAVL
ncbi:MAG: hypothetical protein ACKVT2_15350, partial [Saprospiraceae bacterium]